MKILYLLRSEAGPTVGAFLEEHRKEHEVTVVPLASLRDYDGLVDLIFQSDKVISW